MRLWGSESTRCKQKVRVYNGRINGASLCGWVPFRLFLQLTSPLPFLGMLSFLDKLSLFLTWVNGTVLCSATQGSRIGWPLNSEGWLSTPKYVFPVFLGFWSLSLHFPSVWRIMRFSACLSCFVLFVLVSLPQTVLKVALSFPPSMIFKSIINEFRQPRGNLSFSAHTFS